MGRATEQLAERTGEGVGGLLNATFGNAAELIIALAALRAGLHDVVKASLAGSIVGNILLVLGAAMLAGGLRHQEQHFNAAGARSQATLLTLAAIALILPAAYQRGSAAGRAPEGWAAQRLDLARPARRLRPVPGLLAASPIARSSPGSHAAGGRRRTRAVERRPGRAGARGATAAIAWMSEILVGAIEPTAHELGLNNVFVGVFVVADPRQRRRARHRDHGGAEEPHGPVAVDRDRLERAGGAVRGAGARPGEPFIGPAPMDLAFRGGLVLTVLLAVLITGQVAGDGRSDWLKGVQLLAVYLILGLAFFFAPAAPRATERDARYRLNDRRTSMRSAIPRRPSPAASRAR